jgi:hypothetical protein
MLTSPGYSRSHYGFGAGGLIQLPIRWTYYVFWARYRCLGRRLIEALLRADRLSLPAELALARKPRAQVREGR